MMSKNQNEFRDPKFILIFGHHSGDVHNYTCMPHLNMWLDYGIYFNSDLLTTFTTTSKAVLTTTKLAAARMSADGLGQAI